MSYSFNEIIDYFWKILFIKTISNKKLLSYFIKKIVIFDNFYYKIVKSLYNIRF